MQAHKTRNNHNPTPAQQRTNNIMLPLHLQSLFQESFVDIVVDNAKSHISKGGQVKRRNSEPSCGSSSKNTKNRRRSLKRTRSDPPKPLSRWQSEATPVKRNDLAPACTKPRPSMEASSLHCVLSKPVRRQSIEDPTLLAQLHDSLSSLDGVIDESQCTAAILAKALESLDVYEADVTL